MDQVSKAGLTWISILATILPSSDLPAAGDTFVAIGVEVCLGKFQMLTSRSHQLIMRRFRGTLLRIGC